MSDYRELLLGCGSRREKDIARFLGAYGNYMHQEPELLDAIRRMQMPWKNLSTVDYNRDHKPDIIGDLRYPQNIGYFKGLHSFADEVHAYEVLEHIGQQGDAVSFFLQFMAFHDWLKPGGLFCATCPSWSSPWAWGDPSHTRVITSGTLAFLSQRQYQKQVGVTPMSDFRHLYKADFEPVFVHEDNNTLAFVLRAVK